MFVAKKLLQTCCMCMRNFTQETRLLDLMKMISMFSLPKVQTSENYKSTQLVSNTGVL